MGSWKLFRPRDDDPGLQEAEGGFIRLLDRLANGSQVTSRFIDSELKVLMYNEMQ